MNVLAWLEAGDPVFVDLVARDLRGQSVPYRETGLIRRFFESYVPAARGWGAGLYGPKWIGDHYTLIELKDMGVDPADPRFRESTLHLLHGMWYAGRQKHGRHRHFDVCMAAMMLDLCVYAGHRDPRMQEIVDYLLACTMPDGGWNCGWDGDEPASKSSLHTTISVLQAFDDCRRYGYAYRQDELLSARSPAVEFILKKRLFRSVRTGAVIHRDLIEPHYPPRWKYDVFRALDTFAAAGVPYDPRMDEGMAILRKKLEPGYLRRGSQYGGRIRFPLETGKGGRFNTLRALRILKAYDSTAYAQAVARDIGDPDR